MRVLQILCYYYPKIGGIETVAQDISSAISKKYPDAEQKIICLNEDASSLTHTCHRKENQVDNIDGVEITRCKCVAKISSQSISFSFGKQLKKIINYFNPDLVIFHYPNPLEGRYVKKYLRKDCKFIVFYHLDITKQKILGKFFIHQTNWLLDRADKIISTSPIYAKESPFLSKHPDKVSIVPLCIGKNRLLDNDEIQADAKKIMKEYEGKTLCFFYGRHVPYKGLEYLIKANEFVDRNNIEFVIGGRGPLTEQLEEQAKSYNNIHFVGSLTDSQINSYLKACDLFAFPSITKNEAFGIALAEALYYGKPALTFTNPGSGVNWVSVDNETGLEAANKDVEKYAENINKLAADSNLRKQLAINAKKRAEKYFTIKAFENNIMDVIDNVMEDK